MDQRQKQGTTKRETARERRAKRRQRREALSQAQQEGLTTFSEAIPKRVNVKLPEGMQETVQTALTTAQDALWHLLRRTPFLKIAGGTVGGVVILFILGMLFSGNIGPNVSTIGISLAGLNVEDATERLEDAWEDEIQITVLLEGDVFAEVAPGEIGLQLDAAATAEAAKSVGLSGFPFGYEVEPVVEVSYSDVQTYMLSIVDTVYVPPYEAGFALENGEVVAVPGQASLELDIALTAQHVVDTPLSIVEEKRLSLLTTSAPPTMTDASEYRAEAQRFINSSFTLTGYDPFTNEYQSWQTPPEEMARWLVATPSGLAIEERGVMSFVNTLNSLLSQSEYPRYVDDDEVIASLQSALNDNTTSSQVRIRYLPTTYSVEEGVYGFGISRRTGLPFGQIDNVNPGIDWNVLSIGQEINLPARDIVMPLEPVANKRIIVDLDRLWLVAYENNEVVFHWPISSGRSEAPTYPGVYQILSKDGTAYGSGFSLCGEGGNCAQWEMDYFMSIYEVGPGLMNGFHGAVRLPNGGFLDGGSQQVRSTYGCVMSDNSQAEQLYEWAEEGIVVEIISQEFPAESDLGRAALQYIDSLQQT